MSYDRSDCTPKIYDLLCGLPILWQQYRTMFWGNKLSQVRPLNMEYTLYHMCVTKVLILVNNWRFCEKQFTENAHCRCIAFAIS